MKYKTVVVDPPWPVDFKGAQRLNIVYPRKNKHGRLNEANYELNTIDEILDFPINDFADNNAVLFLWVTSGKIDNVPIIDIGFDILKSWGFSYHTIITWVKHQGLAVFSPIRSITDHILMSWRGNFRNLIKSCGVMPSAFSTHGYQIKHSEKPVRFYQLLRAWTPEPRINVFARNAHEGFDGWGDEYVGDGPLQEYLGPLQEMLEG